MKDREIQELQEAALKEIQAAAKAEDLERLRVKYLGRKGALTQILRSLGQLGPAAPRPGFAVPDAAPLTSARGTAARCRFP